MRTRTVAAVAVAVLLVAAVGALATSGVTVPTIDDFAALEGRVDVLEAEVFATPSETPTSTPTEDPTSTPTEDPTSDPTPDPTVGPTPTSEPEVAIAHGVDIGPQNVGPRGILKPSRSITTSHDGQLIEGLDVSGGITINHADVTIRDVRIARDGRYGIDNRGHHPGLVVEHCEISGADSKAALHTGTFRRCNIHGNVDGVFRQSSTSLPLIVEESWIHDPWNPGGAHNDGIQVRKSSGNVRIVRSRIESTWRNQTSAILIQAKGGPIDGVEISDNLLAGGAFTLYTTDPTYPLTDVTVTGNVWVKDSWQFGPTSGRGNATVWEGNVVAPLDGPVSEPYQVDLDAAVPLD